jgi:hypothetical protein
LDLKARVLKVEVKKILRFMKKLATLIQAIFSKQQSLTLVLRYQ